MKAVFYIVEISTILLSIFFLYRTLEAKINIRSQIIAGVILLCVRMLYYYMGFGYRPYFSLIIGLVYTHFVFAGKIRTHLIWITISIVIDGVVDATIISVYLLFPGAAMELIVYSGIERVVIIILAKTILFVVYYITTLKVDKRGVIPWYDSIYLFLVPAGCWIMLEILFIFGDELPAKPSRFLLVAGSATLLLIIVGVVISHNRMTTGLKQLAHAKMQLRMAKMTQEHIIQVNSIYTQLSTIRHDLNNHFSAIRGYIKAGEYDKLNEYIEHLTSLDISNVVNTKHPVLDALIGTKKEMAKSIGIDFITDITLPEEIPISDVDLCILIGNILDNAFEANKDAHSSRFIHLGTKITNTYWVIACCNTTDNKGNFRSSDSLQSTKSSIGNHGIGTREIKKIAERTGGFVTYQHENYEFHTVVMLKFPDKKAKSILDMKLNQ